MAAERGGSNGAAGCAARAAAPSACDIASRSCLVMRPPAPVPFTWLKIDVVLARHLADQRRKRPSRSLPRTAATGSRRHGGGGGRSLARELAVRQARCRGEPHSAARLRRGAAAAAAPSLIRATTVLMPTVLPSSTRISESVPAAGEGISVSTLSVEISNSGSSRSTCSPGFFSHLVRVPSTMLSPIWGITTSIIYFSIFAGSNTRRETAGDSAAITSSRLASRPKCAHRGHRFGQSARHDVLEITQIRIDIQRKTMRSDPAADVHADGGDLSACSVHTPVRAGHRGPLSMSELRQAYRSTPVRCART